MTLLCPHFTLCTSYLLCRLTPPSAPSIPGFGFSFNPDKRGFEYPQIAQSFNSLMDLLGYSRYVAQGGDIGSFLSCELGQVFPEHCRAVLVNMLVAPAPTFSKALVAWLKWTFAPQMFYSKTEMDNLARTRWFFQGEAGYQVLPKHSTNSYLRE